MYYAKFKADQAKAEEVKDFYHATEIKNDNTPYEYFLTKKNGITIHAYKNKKEIYTIVFSSEDESCIEEAGIFESQISIAKPSEKKEEVSPKDYFQNWEDLHAQIGSDEVGVGDFFGPLIVVSSYVDKDDIDFLERYEINDSKKMKDPYILSIGPILKRRIKNYVVMVSPQKLSLLASNHFNIHKVMAKCHNLSQKGLMEKYHLSNHIITYVDQFTREDDYKKLVGNELISNPLYFRTKGETYFPSVAASSVIARYTFLKEWEKMEEDLGAKIPKGASATVDKIYHELLNRNEKDKVDKYVKKFFSNYER